MTKLIGIDFETNGPEPETCDVTEAAWVLYDTEFGTVPMLSRCLLNSDVNQMDPAAEKITGISIERCKKYGVDREHIKQAIDRDIALFQPDYFVAHNAHGFDKIIFERLCGERTIPWIDTMEDLPTETYERLGTRTLEFMAARSGFLNPFPHAALPDVMTMMKILMAEDIEQVCLRSQIPTVTIAANVSYDNRQDAKDRGYYWENVRGKKYPKKWVKRIKKDEVELEQENAPFTVAIID